MIYIQILLYTFLYIATGQETSTTWIQKLNLQVLNDFFDIMIQIHFPYFKTANNVHRYQDHLNKRMFEMRLITLVGFLQSITRIRGSSFSYECLRKAALFYCGTH